ncbi:aspartate/glutamate racemase family protein [Kordiimonas lipolytica]|uniref:Aspartate/glutamate racemase family protein n=1 Tax=Kordiimonas lipolytica TaxID=1662421 RepID=A0ABV8UF76_9PROT|nr:aspartate/glutamate racemase family protein [Kordiimonas lipolytica]
MTEAKKVKIMLLKTVSALGQERELGSVLSEICAPETEAEIWSLASVPKLTNLEYRTYETFVGPDMLRAIRKAEREGFDAVIIGCFMDPHIAAARELSRSTVIVGSCQASLQVASSLGAKFSVLVGAKHWISHVEELVRHYGYADRLSSVLPMEIDAADLRDDVATTVTKIIDLGRRAIEEDGADVIVMGCTYTFGMYRAIQDALNVPVIDPAFASFKMAELLAWQKKTFGWMQSNGVGQQAPPESEIEAFELFAVPPAIGCRVEIG